MPLKERPETLERALESAVSRALRDNLAPLQRTVDELYQSYTDLVAACASASPSNALPAMLRTQTAAAALSAGLSVLSNFVAIALNPRNPEALGAQAGATVSTSTVVELEEPPVPAQPVSDVNAQKTPGANGATNWVEAPPTFSGHESAGVLETPAAEPANGTVETPAFDIASYVASLPTELQDLHRRANRVAKVAMQDIKLLRPVDVQAGRENKDICVRLRGELDKAHKEYDRRFRAIQEHPVDYFHNWMVEILAGGDTTALGEYPYPSPVLRH
jgi:hypothetical protein